MNILDHGHDHYNKYCGLGELADKSYTYYPKLKEELEQDKGVLDYYGVCVSACPKQFDTVVDYAGQVNGSLVNNTAQYVVGLPTVSILNRCVPYQPPPNKSSSTSMCAAPACNHTPVGENGSYSAQQVCGLQRDGSDRFWLLEEPDVSLKEGWRTEGVAEATINKWVAVANSTGADAAARKHCSTILVRDTAVAVAPDNGDYVLQVVTKYTGTVLTWGAAVFKQWNWVFGLGVLGAMVASLVVLMLLTTVVRCVLMIMTFLLFIVLGALDYVLFYQAGIITGQAGHLVIGAIDDASRSLDLDDDVQKWMNTVATGDTQEYYKWGAIGLLVIICLLFCIVCALWRNIELLVRLLKEAARTIREMPSLILFPIILVGSGLCWAYLLVHIWLGIATIEPHELETTLGKLGVDDPQDFQRMQAGAMWALVFGFLWMYFFHVGLFVSLVASTVSNWYFYRDDPERHGGTGMRSDSFCPGKPVLLAFWRTLRYHVGSIAFGSWVMTMVTMPRIVFEYIVHQSKADDQTAVIKCCIRVTRCLLWCFQKCMEFITAYAYVYVAVTGRPFCRSCHASFVLFAKYPAQVALDQLASKALGILACITVPALMIMASMFVVNEDWMACAVFIALLSYSTTRFVVGVYDICVTTLFVCLMRDIEHYGGKYMTAGLAAVCDLEHRDCDDRRPSTELTGSFHGDDRRPEGRGRR